MNKLVLDFESSWCGLQSCLVACETDFLRLLYRLFYPQLPSGLAQGHVAVPRQVPTRTAVAQLSREHCPLSTSEQTASPAPDSQAPGPSAALCHLPRSQSGTCVQPLGWHSSWAAAGLEQAFVSALARVH